MKPKRKLLCLVLTVCLLLPAVLSSCGTKYGAVMTYKGIPLTEDKYLYWTSTFKRNILSAYRGAVDADSFWQSSYDGTKTVEEHFTEVIETRIRHYLIAQDLFKQNRLTLDSGIRGQIDADIAEKIDYYGGKAALNRELETLMLTVDSLKDIYLWEEKYNRVYDYYFGQDGIAAVTDAELASYYENHYHHIRYIVFYLTGIETDEKGNYVYDDGGKLVTAALTEEERAEKERKIAECEARIAAGEDFDALREAYSEYDTSAYENGFLISRNEFSTWGEGILSGAERAEAGQTFRVNEEEAVFFVRKEELTPLGSLTEGDLEQLSSLFSNASREKADEMFAELASDVVTDAVLTGRYRLSEIKPNPFYSI